MLDEKKVFQASHTAGALSFDKSGIDSQEGVNVTTFTTTAPRLFDKLLTHQVANLEVGGKEVDLGFIVELEFCKISLTMKAPFLFLTARCLLFPIALD